MFLSHYGEAYHCTISQIRVFGETMLVDFRNDLIKNFHTEELVEEKKKPSFIQIPKSTITNRSLSIISSPSYKSYKSRNFPIKSLQNRTLLFLFDENYCDNIPFFSNNSNEQTIIVSNENQRNDENEGNNEEFIQNDECPNTMMAFLLNRREQICSSSEKKEDIPRSVALKEHDTDVGVESIFKVLTKHIKVYLRL